MSFLKALLKRKNEPPKTPQERYLEIQEKVRQQFRYGWNEGIQRWCFTCKWWIYREEKPRNWVCRCPDELLKFGKTPVGCDECLGWGLNIKFVPKLEKDLK